MVKLNYVTSGNHQGSLSVHLPVTISKDGIKGLKKVIAKSVKRKEKKAKEPKKPREKKAKEPKKPKERKAKVPVPPKKAMEPAKKATPAEGSEFIARTL
jgi:hypothetical protein